MRVLGMERDVLGLLAQPSDDHIASIARRNKFSLSATS